MTAVDAMAIQVVNIGDDSGEWTLDRDTDVLNVNVLLAHGAGGAHNDRFGDGDPNPEAPLAKEVGDWVGV